MSNAASLFLPGSNLTNLIVLHHERVSGATFLAHMWPAAVASVVTTTLILIIAFWSALGAPAGQAPEPVRAHVGLGAAGVAVSTVLVLALASPALPVLIVGVAVVLLARIPAHACSRPPTHACSSASSCSPSQSARIGRWWHGPEHLVNSFDRWQTAATGAISAIAINNLPAAMLLSANPPAHSRALLIGLNLGPNLAVTGSLSAVLWLRVARSHDARPSVRTYTLLGLVLVPLSIAAALAALAL